MKTQSALCVLVVSTALALAAEATAATISFRNTATVASGADAGATLAGFNMMNTGGDTSQLLIVTLAGEFQLNATSVTFDGQSMLAGPTITTGTGTAATTASIWYLLNPTSSVGDIVLTKPTTPDGNGYRFGAMSFGADAAFVTPTSSDTAVSTTTSITLNVDLDDSASPGNPFVAIGSYGGNLNAATGTTGFDAFAYNVSTTDNGGYFALGGYAIEPSGSTTLSVTQSSNRHVFAGLAVSVVPEPSTFVLAGLAGLGLLAVRTKRRLRA